MRVVQESLSPESCARELCTILFFERYFCKTNVFCHRVLQKSFFC
jgi:hypothetical protein